MSASTSTGTLAGHRVTHARVHLPAFGVWWAEASLDEAAKLTGQVELAIADLKLAGTIMSGGPGPQDRASYRIAGGKGTWGKTIAAASYANDAGVKVSTVLADAARLCGEALDMVTVPERRLGPAFTRPEDPAARVLELCFPAGWYVGEDGITRIGQRPTVTLGADVPVASVDLSTGTVELAAEEIATILPGIVVETVQAVDVLHELAPGQLRTRLWGNGIAPTSRRLAALRRLVGQLDPHARFRGVWEYRVLSQASDRLTLQPIRVSTGMPNLQRVPVRPGVPGASFDLAAGSRVLVSFVDADPARPIVVGFEDVGGPGFLAESLTLGASGSAPPAARQGDAVKVPFPPAIFSGTIIISGVPSPATGALTFTPNYGIGVIEGGSGLVRIG